LVDQASKLLDFLTDPKEQIGRKHAIKIELSDILYKKEFWDKVANKDVPPERKLIGSR
jgi:hypothetical protein